MKDIHTYGKDKAGPDPCFKAIKFEGHFINFVNGDGILHLENHPKLKK